MMELVTDPDGFYDRVKGDTSLVGPLAVIGLLGAVRLLREVVVQLGGSSVDWVAVFGSLLYFVVFAVVWVVIGGTLHVVSGLFDPAEEGFGLTLRLVGYGFLPAAIGTALELLAAGVLVGAGAANVVDQPVFRMFDSLYMDLVFLVWAAFLWSFALKHARNLSLREAAGTVVVGLGVVVAGLLVTTLLLGAVVG